MINIDLRELRQFESDLLTYRQQAYPFATRWTLHTASKRAQRLATERVREEFTLRNRYTERTIQFAPRSANQITLNVNRQRTFVGSTEPYMKKQEFGATEIATGQHGLAIPTGWAAGQEGAIPRTRLPRGARKLENIRLRGRRPRGANRAQRNVIAVQQAIQTGNRYTFLDFGRTKGIFRVIGGGRRSPRRGWPPGVRVKMAYDVSRRSVRIPETRWLYPSSMATRQEMPRFYRDSLLHQIRRHGLFRG